MRREVGPFLDHSESLVNNLETPLDIASFIQEMTMPSRKDTLVVVLKGSGENRELAGPANLDSELVVNTFLQTAARVYYLQENSEAYQLLSTKWRDLAILPSPGASRIFPPPLPEKSAVEKRPILKFIENVVIGFGELLAHLLY